jgi:Sec-independent protein secretion pathway component TatC
MVLFMLVLITLYFVGVGVSWMVVRKKKQREAAEAH